MPSGRAEENTVILVMDCCDDDVKLATCLLRKAGFHVIQSSKHADIVTLCHSSKEAVQLVIIDTTTPGIHIAELLNQVQEADPRIRYLVLSNSKETDPVEKWSVTGNIRGHLSRPFRRAQFLGSVLEAVKEPLPRTA